MHSISLPSTDEIVEMKLMLGWMNAMSNVNMSSSTILMQGISMNIKFPDYL
jgi:hypothetical protein